jgi:hypothetical protein
MMKKVPFYTLLVFLFITSKQVSAQEFSIMGGFNASNMSSKFEGKNYSDQLNYNTRLGGHAAFLVDLKIGKVFSIEPGLMFITKGYKSQFSVPNSSDFRLKYNTYYMDIPILAKFNWNPKENFRVYGGLGPVIGIGLFGKIKPDNINADQQVYFQDNYPGIPTSDKSIDFGDDNKRMDVGLMVTTGINVSKFRVGVFYNQGLRNIALNQFKTRNRVFGISAGYTFQFKNDTE